MERIYIDPYKIDAVLVEKAASQLRQGGIVVLPTETVYGLAGRVDKKDVVERLYKIKQRDKDRPFAYAVSDVQKVIDHYFGPLSPFGYRLIEEFWPGPLTLIYYSPRDEKIGIRVPDHRVAQAIIKNLDVPVYLPSANPSGEKEAVSAKEAEDFFGDQVDLIVDGGKCYYGRASTVVDLTYHPFEILREGTLPVREIISVFIKKRILFVCTGNTCRSPMAQFLLWKHILENKSNLKNRYEILSRGIAAGDGYPLSSYAAKILQEKEGLEVEEFSSKRLDREIVRSSDLIFTMEDKQSEYILDLEPTAEGRVFGLKKFLPPKLEKDIDDPMGKGFDVYEKGYYLLKEAVSELKEWL